MQDVISLVVLREGFAPPTQAFSGLCSTPELPKHNLASKYYTALRQIECGHLYCYRIALKDTYSIFP